MKHLSKRERAKIGLWRSWGWSYEKIGKALGRAKSTVRNEYKKHLTRGGKYIPEMAQKLAESKVRQSKKKAKLDTNPHLRFFVFERLKENWSPEQISGFLKNNPEPKLGYICDESIYQYIYSQTGRENWYYFLRHKRKQRIKRHFRPRVKSKIKGRVSIHLRPKEIEQKQSFGHWESDSVQSRGRKIGLSVQYERKTQLVSIHRIPDKTAQSTLDALNQTRAKYQVKSITFDNGTEGSLHYKLKIPTYFCDPYCSWQKGGVENINKLIRQYLPKKASPDLYTDEFISFIENCLNNRPRKSLNFLSPIQFIKKNFPSVSFTP